ncbi:MAG: site-2 protease family protein [Oscillospiraceae bacterium]|nr:site-2 protease family protein [Oscillospiraceae bacterium]
MQFLNLDPMSLIVRAIILFTCLPFHEFAHAYAANKLGDPTARYQGRLTLNPVKHLDLMGSIMIMLAGIGWAKPVPVNPVNFKNRKNGMMMVAAAGPLSNLFLAFVFMIISKLLWYSGINPELLVSVISFLNLFILMNITLAVFNLLPIPPLDGSRIITLFLPSRTYFKIMEYERYIFIILIFLLFSGVLRGVIEVLSDFVWTILHYMTIFVDLIARAL